MLTDDVKLEPLIIGDVLFDEMHLDLVGSTGRAAAKHPRRYPVQRRGMGDQIGTSQEAGDGILFKGLPASATNTATPESLVVQEGQRQAALGFCRWGKFDSKLVTEQQSSPAAAKPLSLPIAAGRDGK